jgi:phosphoribosyl-ATP pyrophosphohydrolase/phosphoribosyl-AMP cyclohydrolase
MFKQEKINLRNLKFDKQGLIPAIIQDYKTKEVLMLAYMNRESLKRSMKSGRTCFWSRSRKAYWVKGETSGNFQFIKEMRYDCDMDALLIKVRQVGVACHTGNRSCFYRKLNDK